jgi:ribosomal protein S18 acetylase RimI-like enzyme
MPTIRPLPQIDMVLLRRLIVGYHTHEIYRLEKNESDAATSLTLRLMTLDQPFVKEYAAALDGTTVTHYAALARAGHVLGAFADDDCVGLAITEMHAWNASLAVWEFHVDAVHQGQGIGRQLMEAVCNHARALHARIVLCETQATNVPAIRFYRAVGFVLDGIDCSFYTNADVATGEVAVFMKRQLV